MNFGFPLISSSTVLSTNCVNIRPRDIIAERGMDEACSFSEPIPNYQEQVFYRDSAVGSYAKLENPDINLSVKIRFNKKELPYFIEWKQMGEQEYVVGMEPATYPPDGRALARQRNELLVLKPQESRAHELVIEVQSI